MPGAFEIDLAALRSSASDVASMAADLDDAVLRLRAGLHRLGTPWGSDDPGRAFAGQHVPSSGRLLEHLDQLVAGLASVGNGLEVMAERYEDSEGASTIPGATR